MSRAGSRVQLTTAYVLHQRPFRDSSLIVEVFARDHGRLTVFAHAARGTRSRFATLQPFRALLLGPGAVAVRAPQLTAAENAGERYQLPAAHLMSAFYLNELLIKLVTRHDPHPELFDHYQQTLRQLLSQGAKAENCCAGSSAPAPSSSVMDSISRPEADTGQPVRGDAHYHFHPGVHGFVIAEPGQHRRDSRGTCCIACRQVPVSRMMPNCGEARTLMRAALDHCLDGRELTTRTVARSLRNYPRKERTG